MTLDFPPTQLKSRSNLLSCPKLKYTRLELCMKTGSIDGIGLNLPVCVTTVHDKFALNNKRWWAVYRSLLGVSMKGWGKPGYAQMEALLADAIRGLIG